MVKAPLGKRIVAYIIDSIIVGIVMGVFYGVGFVLMMMGRGRGVMIIIGILCMLVGFGLMLLYWLLRDGMFNGRSLGKKVMGLKVVNTAGNRACSYKDSFLRNITLVIPIVGFIDIIIALVDSEGLRMGDKIAKTQVQE